MNEKYLQTVMESIPDRRVLINAVCRRINQLATGARPLVPTLPDQERNWMDIALQEFAEGKIRVRYDGGESEGRARSQAEKVSI
ncbi:MAG: DNA-directed RNA polymerase subunit omega [Verrucomicrobiota bacterium]